ncbi:hypothetical protein, conserved [Eimeria tenella]|uniref:Ca2+-activated K+ channel Slowpoke-like C-terminal domain-containing protein n=1 Tax=Eimeria tenella TaxID=5802 RepID=U6L6P6_EIMTE|nr:hypothetical protein, conserved [Eimeria tenella]CDJ43435.1 hypothetical protein, conserved [Eimeria tenella]|eukprot:XP_013234185.1 hypothetical protein, conserved [Eimeria tenella]
MFYGAVAHALPVSKYSVEVGVINSLVLARPSARGGSAVPLCLESIPPMFFGSSFRRLFEHLLTMEKKIAVGVYRQLTSSPQLELQDQPLAIVISCPSRDLKLCPTDQVYVITQGLPSEWMP